jgi:tocopherol O-methyltransferase
VNRALRRLATDSRYLRFVLRGHARDRIFAVTLFRLLLAYRTGAMRYVVLTATKTG